MRCKVGDLAVIVSTNHTPDAVGGFVDVLEWVQAGVEAKGLDGKSHHSDVGTWLCHAKGWKCNVRRSSGTGYFQSEWFLIEDHHLRPIRPGSLDEETTESRELEAA